MRISVVLAAPFGPRRVKMFQTSTRSAPSKTCTFFDFNYPFYGSLEQGKAKYQRKKRGGRPPRSQDQVFSELLPVRSWCLPTGTEAPHAPAEPATKSAAEALPPKPRPKAEAFFVALSLVVIKLSLE